jgi:heme A synthase
MATHLINTFFLLGALTLTAFHAGRARDGKQAARLTPATAAGLLGMLLVGASGAIAALGDTLFPAGTLAEALRQDLSPTAHLLVRLRTLHPFFSISVGALLVWLAAARCATAARRTPGVPPAPVIGLVFAQSLLGVLNVALLAPIVLQIAHLLLADALWIALVLLAASIGRTAESPNWEDARLVPDRVASRNA